MTYPATPPKLARYDGTGWPLFQLAFGTGLLTLMTLGIYRFWAKTRLRRYIWSSTRLDGDAFEYTGTGLEKFLGFLVAVVVLAVYLAVVQLVLFSLGLRYVMQPETQAEVLAQLALIYGSFLAVLPLLFYASYRARRYKLARTRFRGIRFGMEQGAGGYAWRAMLLVIVALLSLGLLVPLATFRLEKYLTDRTAYGDARFVQGGRWGGLYRAMIHIFIGFGILVVAVAAAAAEAAPIAVLLGAVGYVWMIFGVVVYRVQSFAYLMRHKRLGAAIGFTADPHSGSVIGRYLLGGLLMAVILAVVGGVLAGIGLAVVGTAPLEPSAAEPPVAVLIAGAVLYLVLLVFAGALSLSLITQPILAHFTETVGVTNLQALSAIRQRSADAGADAGGLADALDIGGAF